MTEVHGKSTSRKMKKQCIHTYIHTYIYFFQTQHKIVMTRNSAAANMFSRMPIRVSCVIFARLPVMLRIAHVVSYIERVQTMVSVRRVRRKSCFERFRSLRMLKGPNPSLRHVGWAFGCSSTAPSWCPSEFCVGTSCWLAFVLNWLCSFGSCLCSEKWNSLEHHGRLKSLKRRVLYLSIPGGGSQYPGHFPRKRTKQGAVEQYWHFVGFIFTDCFAKYVGKRRTGGFGDHVLLATHRYAQSGHRGGDGLTITSEPS